MGNPFTYLQLHTSDLEKAKEFYSGLFDWKLDEAPIPGGTYIEVLVGEGTGGGMMKVASPGTPSHWLPFIAVEEVQSFTQRAESLGAKVLVTPTVVPGKGRYSVVLDPTGAAFALWQKAE
jgi:uncharacterized protein